MNSSNNKPRNHHDQSTNKKQQKQDPVMVASRLVQEELPNNNNNNMLLVDIGINLTHRTFRKNWKTVVKRAIDAGVTRMILTGTSITSSRESIQLAKTWYANNNSHDDDGNTGVEGAENKQQKQENLLCTVGIHPHDAKTFKGDKTINEMRSLIQENNSFVVAIGECGLDFDRNFSSKDDQIYAFREQVKLAVELQMPLFVHERDAHEDLIRILDEFQAAAVSHSQSLLPPIVVHCFTGTHDEALAYLKRGYYIGFTGTICKQDRGAHLRNLVLPSIPLERIMIETDAPFMSFVNIKGQRNSEPAHVLGVAKQLSKTLGIPLERVCVRDDRDRY